MSHRPGPRSTCRSAAFAVLSVLSATAQSPAPPADLTVTSNLVVVPALVTAPTGTLVHALNATDFTLLDNGIAQRVSLDDANPQPLAIVVLLQTGATAPRQFANYAGLATMLDYLTSGSAHRIALLTFDSRPEYEWPFASTTVELKDALLHPDTGDRGAAIFDAVNQGIDLLSQRPPAERRVLLLLSQPQDDGSAARAEDVVRRLGENNITLYSVTFSPAKTWLKDQFTQPRHEQPPYQLNPMPGAPPLLHTFDLGTPLFVALKAARTNAAAELARLSGGEALAFDNRRDFDDQLTLIANHISNRYMLTFTPSSKQPGFHTLQVQIPGRSGLQISARASYWLAAPN